MAEIESVVEPYGIGNDVRWESMAFIGIHPPILAISAIQLGSTWVITVSLSVGYPAPT